jgi:phage tail sheath protein FI
MEVGLGPTRADAAIPIPLARVPEYLAPGVYVEEVSYRAKSIDGVETSTAGFVGAAEMGPVNEPFLVRSTAELEETYGDRCHLVGAGRAFFEQGGRKLFAQRIEGTDDAARGLQALERIREISIVAAPGLRAVDLLVDHAERCNRFAVLDPTRGQSIDDAIALRRRIDSGHAAIYYPWVRTAAGTDVPPSGYVAGLYARIDAERGVWHAPAGESLVGAAGLERELTENEVATLAASDVNPVRVLPNRGIVVWGARTTSTDPEWKYVSVRRYVTFLEHSIDRGTQWTVFEPNAEPLWADVRTTIEAFLLGQFRAGGFQGRTPDEAFFVKCDRTTMTQDDIDQGLLVCLVGVAVVRPAEFVIFRIGRWTADHRP